TALNGAGEVANERRLGGPRRPEQKQVLASHHRQGDQIDNVIAADETLFERLDDLAAQAVNDGVVHSSFGVQPVSAPLFLVCRSRRKAADQRRTQNHASADATGRNNAGSLPCSCHTNSTYDRPGSAGSQAGLKWSARRSA